MALKGRKSLPNRLSLVNSYDFVIRENCRKCKTTMPNCNSSKPMPLITVTGETQWKLEWRPRPSLLPWGCTRASRAAPAGWAAVFGMLSCLLAHLTATASSVLAERWLLFTFAAFRAALCEEQALMKEKQLNSWLLLVSRSKTDSWRARDKRKGAKRGWYCQQVASETRNEWRVQDGEARLVSGRNPVCCMLTSAGRPPDVWLTGVLLHKCP